MSLLVSLKNFRLRSADSSVSNAISMDHPFWGQSQFELILCFGTYGNKPLVALLDGTEGQRRFAATALMQLACNEPNREEIAKKEAIKPLISMLQSENKRLKKCAARALGNLAINRRNRNQIASEEVVEHLVGLLGYASDGLKDYIAFVLGLLSCGQPADQFGSAIEPLLRQLASGTDLQKEFAAFALGNLSSDFEISSAIMNQEAVDSLVSLLSVGSEYQKVYAARTFTNLAEHAFDIESWSQKGVL